MRSPAFVLLYTPKPGEKALGFYNGSEERIAAAFRHRAPRRGRRKRSR